MEDKIELETKDEKKWFSYLKQKAHDLNYGCLELSVVVKGGKIVAFRSCKAIENFNIRDNS
jgi:hypothetical protein